MEYSVYQKFFKNIYSQSDFLKRVEIKGFMPEKMNPEEEVLFEEFVSWSSSFFPKNQMHWCQRVFENFDELYFVQEKLSRKKWVHFFENYLARNEIVLQKGVPKGVFILSLSEAQDIPFDKMVVLGLSEKNLSINLSTALHWTDVESIRIKFGFDLAHVDRGKFLQDLGWLKQKKLSESYFYHSEMDFSGDFQSPSLYWLQGALEQGGVLNTQVPKKNPLGPNFGKSSLYGFKF